MSCSDLIAINVVALVILLLILSMTLFLVRWKANGSVESVALSAICVIGLAAVWVMPAGMLRSGCW